LVNAYKILRNLDANWYHSKWNIFIHTTVIYLTQVKLYIKNILTALKNLDQIFSTIILRSYISTRLVPLPTGSNWIQSTIDHSRYYIILFTMPINCPASKHLNICNSTSQVVIPSCQLCITRIKFIFTTIVEINKDNQYLVSNMTIINIYQLQLQWLIGLVSY
jgi:hypothetical protein